MSLWDPNGPVSSRAVYRALVIRTADEFLKTWRLIRRMTLDYLNFVSDEVLDLRPAPTFRTMREQAVHLAELQGVYQLALRGEAVDYGRGPEFSPASGDRSDIVAAMAERDRDYTESVEQLLPRGPDYRLEVWHRLTLAEFDIHHVQHETLHHGQWITLTALAGHPQPPLWVQLWAL
jgi:uncharacterized damage-inducible protein DinB